MNKYLKVQTMIADMRGLNEIGRRCVIQPPCQPQPTTVLDPCGEGDVTVPDLAYITATNWTRTVADGPFEWFDGVHWHVSWTGLKNQTYEVRLVKENFLFSTLLPRFAEYRMTPTYSGTYGEYAGEMTYTTVHDVLRVDSDPSFGVVPAGTVMSGPVRVDVGIVLACTGFLACGGEPPKTAVVQFKTLSLWSAGVPVFDGLREPLGWSADGLPSPPCWNTVTQSLEFDYSWGQGNPACPYGQDAMLEITA
jgi:hypothetical protein